MNEEPTESSSDERKTVDVGCAPSLAPCKTAPSFWDKNYEGEHSLFQPTLL